MNNLNKQKNNHFEKQKQDPDYRAFFIMGITWIPVGIVINNYGISAMGLIFMITGLVNKDKWKKQKWSELSDEKKRLKLLIILFLGASMLLGLIMYLIFNNK